MQQATLIGASNASVSNDSTVTLSKVTIAQFYGEQTRFAARVF